jgi:uncharacterized protein (TIGR02757 family)
MKNHQELKDFLDKKVKLFNQTSFIKNDPISIPHRFSKKQDIEISGLFAALFAWGNRTTIINKATSLLDLMDNAPYDFIRYHSDKSEYVRFQDFKHRTFQGADISFLLNFLAVHYSKHDSLEDAFIPSFYTTDNHAKERLEHFYNYAFSHPHLARTEKHISTPAKNSACKRINMYLRWMVRHDKQGVDFGVWKKIKPSELLIPLDVHVCRVANGLGLMDNQKSNWKETVKLTEKLRLFDAKDPVKYDYALFGMGVNAK